MKHLKILIEGTVQGVGFRWAVRSQANLLGVKGFVRNEMDGAVYIEAEAEETVLEQFVAWCRRGPPAAHVDHLDVREGRPARFAGFDIRS
jgi:acylphosphatase